MSISIMEKMRFIVVFPREYTGGWAGYGVIDWDSTWNCSIKDYPTATLKVKLVADNHFGGLSF